MGTFQQHRSTLYQGSKKNSSEFVCFAFDHQARNEEAKNNFTFTTIDFVVPGDP